MFEAMNYFEKNDPELKYKLPIELDLSFNSGTKGGATDIDKKKIREAMIREAIGYFDSALGLDPDYAPSYQNKACAYYLLGDFTRATFYAETEAKIRAEMDTIKYGKTGIDAQVLLALIDIQTGKTTAGTRKLKRLRSESSIARHNYRIAESLPAIGKDSEDGPEWEIDGEADVYLKFRNSKKSKDLKIFEADKLRVYDNPEDGFEHSKIYRYKPKAGDERPDAYFMITDPDYPGETWDEFKVGSKRKDIVTEYGRPNKTLETVNGEMMVYESMILIMDAKRRLSRWVLYLEK
jgi:tetratricopeptide (TPR) repeat protein